MSVARRIKRQMLAELRHATAEGEHVVRAYMHDDITTMTLADWEADYLSRYPKASEEEARREGVRMYEEAQMLLTKTMVTNSPGGEG